MKRLTAVMLAATLLGGCVNSFSKYYQPQNPANPASLKSQLLPPPNQPALYTHSDNVQADAMRMATDGYVLIGTSSFYAPANKVTKDQAIAQGKEVGASVVLIKSQYKDTRSGVVPFTLANPNVVSTVNTSGTVYGTNGNSATYSGSGTVTTPGGYSTYAIPYSVDRNDFFASYWAKRDPNKIHLGLNYLPLPNEVRKKLERNTGVQVAAVVKGTPAFKANFIEGDILLSLNGEDIIDVASLSAALNQLAGQRITFNLLRDYQPREISVTLNP
jgi:hypothetical protein